MGVTFDDYGPGEVANRYTVDVPTWGRAPPATTAHVGGHLPEHLTGCPTVGVIKVSDPTTIPVVAPTDFSKEYDSLVVGDNVLVVCELFRPRVGMRVAGDDDMSQQLQHNTSVIPITDKDSFYVSNGGDRAVAPRAVGTATTLECVAMGLGPVTGTWTDNKPVARTDRA